MLNLVYLVFLFLKIFNCHLTIRCFLVQIGMWISNGILFKHDQNIEHVIHLFIVEFIQENYHSGDAKFSLFDIKGQIE